jgi:hypothetical protein
MVTLPCAAATYAVREVKFWKVHVMAYVIWGDLVFSNVAEGFSFSGCFAFY